MAMEIHLASFGEQIAVTELIVSGEVRLV